MIIAKQKDTGKFRYLITHDVRQGLGRAWAKFLVAGVLFGVFAAVYLVQAGNILRAGEVHEQTTLGDLLLYIYQGMPVYTAASGEAFTVPAMWLIVNLYIAFIVVIYPYNDLLGVGHQVLIRAGRRWQWWLSKCAWNVCCVALYYGIGYAVILLSALIGGAEMRMKLTESGAVLANVGIAWANPVKFSWAVFLLPALSSLALCLLQMTLSMFVKPVISYMVTAGVLVASAFFATPLLPGNHSMLVRSEALMPGGIALHPAALVDVVIIAAAVAAGIWRFRKYDILDRS